MINRVGYKMPESGEKCLSQSPKAFKLHVLSDKQSKTQRYLAFYRKSLKKPAKTNIWEGVSSEF